MDGLLILGLIVWAIFRKKKKKQPNKVNTERKTAQGNEQQRRSERLEKIHAEIERRKMELQMQPVAPIRPVVGEGESLFTNTAFDQTASLEGECICDPELEHAGESLIEPETVYAGEIGKEPLVDFSARGMLQGVVMSEILTRPSQRVSRR